MVGTVGWDYDDWVGSYYPDDLPQGWRFGYYSNDYRSVLVPEDHLSSTDLSIVKEWFEDSGEEFRFVLQPPSALFVDTDLAHFEEFLKQIGELSGRIAGLFLSMKNLEIDIEGLTSILEMASKHMSVCADLPEDLQESSEVAELMSRINSAQCWYPEAEPAPGVGGSLMVAISDSQDAKEQRRQIELLEDWMKRSGGVAGLFFSGGASAPKAASQARIIAEMMGI